MYIAFKWLLCLSLLMWIGICFVELIHKRSKDIVEQEIIDEIYRNKSASNSNMGLIKHKNNNPKYHQANTGLYHFAIFIFVAFTLMNRKEIILRTKFKIMEKSYFLDLNKTAKMYGGAALDTLKKLTSKFRVAMNKNLKLTWGIILDLALKIKKYADKKVLNCKDPKINLLLLEKLKEVGEQKNNMGHLLLAAIQECNSVRHQLQLEIISKNKLIKCIEDSKSLLKDSQNKCAHIQNLHTTVQYEKNVLKARLRQVSREKDDCKSIIAKLIHKINESKNYELVTFCSNIIRPSQDSSLKRSENNESTNNLRNLNQHNNSKGIYIKDDSQVTHISKIHQQTSQTSSYLPLKETAGECIWTTKNKDGLLEKVFEYGYDSKHDNSGDTRRIRRIREYSVQCDKECQLDYQRLETVVTQRIRCQNQNFLTGSEAFKNFLENNLNSLNSPKHC